MVLSSIYWFTIALLIALVEIETEGKYGWAEKSATWSKRIPTPKLFRLFSGTRTLTGYHLFLNIFLLLFMHATFVFSGNFSIDREFELLATYLTWTVYWDFLWFILNPYYGWQAFSPKAVWWFGEEPWVLNKLPLKYFIQIGITLLLSLIAGIISGKSEPLISQFVLIAGMTVLTLISHFLLRPVYHKYYWKLHKKVA